MTYLQSLLAMDKDDLVNALYNVRTGDWADYDEARHDLDPHGHGKRIPYIGWFWRDTDFVRKRIAIGDSGSFIGVMENNKWDYPERMMTEAEADTFIAYLNRAFAEASRGGIVAETRAAAERVFREMWEWFQTLKIEETTR